MDPSYLFLLRYLLTGVPVCPMLSSLVFFDCYCLIFSVTTLCPFFYTNTFSQWRP
ncbi:hypothetical protein P167DRAFT_24626 [Morchella conica CCBAS932]|uniref:Uncharacterized protein n=1 Tax=Morchella conica CCBAS932 TaxID=1392247 RepID=A0A3N4K8P5_9PEZI|nr:hypothetical protein P167DRAFT_24626 [Morchella conica CCBAS932]